MALSVGRMARYTAIAWEFTMPMIAGAMRITRTLRKYKIA